MQSTYTRSSPHFFKNQNHFPGAHEPAFPPRSTLKRKNHLAPRATSQNTPLAKHKLAANLCAGTEKESSILVPRRRAVWCAKSGLTRCARAKMVSSISALPLGAGGVLSSPRDTVKGVSSPMLIPRDSSLVKDDGEVSTVLFVVPRDAAQERGIDYTFGACFWFLFSCIFSCIHFDQHGCFLVFNYQFVVRECRFNFKRKIRGAWIRWTKENYKNGKRYVVRVGLLFLKT